MDEKERDPRSRKVHHYLHESSIGVADAYLSPQNSILFQLPATIIRPQRDYGIRIDPRDKRTLVAFDGDILPGGIPKNGDLIYQHALPGIITEKQRVRKSRSWEDDPESVDVNQMDAVLNIERIFLLLPNGRAVVRKYRHDSFSPIYVMIEVGPKEVIWRNSSY